MVHPYKLLTKEYNLSKVKGHYLICIATNKVPQSSNALKFSNNHLLLKCLVSVAMKASLVRTVECKLQKERLYDTKRNIQLEHVIVIYVPTSQEVSRLISFFHIAKKAQLIPAGRNSQFLFCHQVFRGFQCL